MTLTNEFVAIDRVIANIAPQSDNKIFNLRRAGQGDAPPFDFVVAHGCAGTGHQHGIRAKLDVYYRAIKALYPNASVLHFLLGDNVYTHGCQSEEGHELTQFFHNIYYKEEMFPWDFCFGILGNHDYNYINPFVRWFSRAGIHGPIAAFNQIIQSYSLQFRHRRAYPVPLIPARYYIVDTHYAFYFCLDTNVLLFDTVQQEWLANTLNMVCASQHRNKFLVINCHQPLQTFGKRSQSNGDSDYYFQNVTDPGEKSALNALIRSLLPYAGSKPKIPLSILLRLYLERAFMQRGLRIAIVSSAHDHFNECSFFGINTLQIITGVMGLHKDIQADQITTANIDKLERSSHARHEAEPTKTIGRIRDVFGQSQLERIGRSQMGRTTVPQSGLGERPPHRPHPVQPTVRPHMPHGIGNPHDIEHARAVIADSTQLRNHRDLQEAQALYNRFFAATGQIPIEAYQDLGPTNGQIRIQITLPLLIISEDFIQIKWQIADSNGNPTAADPINIPKPSLDHTQVLAIINQKISERLGFIEILVQEANLRTKSIFGTSSTFVSIMDKFQVLRSDLDERRLLELLEITNSESQKTQILRRESSSFYKELNYILLDLWCLYRNLIDFTNYTASSGRRGVT